MLRHAVAELVGAGRADGLPARPLPALAAAAALPRGLPGLGRRLIDVARLAPRLGPMQAGVGALPTQSAAALAQGMRSDGARDARVGQPPRALDLGVGLGVGVAGGRALLVLRLLHPLPEDLLALHVEGLALDGVAPVHLDAVRLVQALQALLARALARAQRPRGLALLRLALGGRHEVLGLLARGDLREPREVRLLRGGRRGLLRGVPVLALLRLLAPDFLADLGDLVLEHAVLVDDVHERARLLARLRVHRLRAHPLDLLGLPEQRRDLLLHGVPPLLHPLQLLAHVVQALGLRRRRSRQPRLPLLLQRVRADAEGPRG
mmetsp:Transcript_40036/g.125300  ORF Transcript_40036/g.125300 Transcript_40036/m.125300 type:complete len:321 (-) Transcript_40036:405-1367(-)